METKNKWLLESTEKNHNLQYRCCIHVVVFPPYKLLPPENLLYSSLSPGGKSFYIIAFPP